MNRMQLGIALALKELGVECTRRDNFREKKNSAYLVQAAGIQGNYFFFWHHSGTVAARGLADDFCEISSEEFRDWVLDDGTKSKLARLKPLIAFDDLELLTSAHFLVTRNQARGNGEVRRILGKYGRNYSPEKVDEAVCELRKYSLLEA